MRKFRQVNDSDISPGLVIIVCMVASMVIGGLAFVANTVEQKKSFSFTASQDTEIRPFPQKTAKNHDCRAFFDQKSGNFGLICSKKRNISDP